LLNGSGKDSEASLKAKKCPFRVVHIGIPKYEEEPKPLKLVTFALMFSVLLAGLIISAIAFVFEQKKRA